VFEHAAHLNSRSLLLKNARVIDGLGTVEKAPQCIHIQDGEIVAIGRDLEVEGLPVLDVAGATVLPGLIDAHVHLQSVPGSAFRKDSDETLHKYRYHQLRAYLACGVTTVLDNAISAPMLREFQNYLAAGGVGPRLYALAPAFYPPGGYLDHDMLTPYWGPQWRPVGSREDILSLFDEYEGLKHIVGVKTMLETGFGKSKIWPLHPPEIRKIIVEEASRRNLPVYVHAYKEKEQAVGLEMGAHTFVHSGFIFEQPKKDFLERLKAQGTYVTTTLSCSFDQMLVNFELGRLDDEFLRLTVPEELLQTARNLEAWDEYYDTFFKNSSPKWMPAFILKAITRMLNIERLIRSCLANASAAIVTMHQSGIPIVVGTDASSWPVFLNFFHGTSTIREIELLVGAGMPPVDVIASATRIPAEMMGLEQLIGTIELGKRADLVVVRGDPLKNVSALKSVAWTIKDGEAHTPEEWMSMTV
jgi:imidazolonepropionase-like amidohydrolase